MHRWMRVNNPCPVFHKKPEPRYEIKAYYTGTPNPFSRFSFHYLFQNLKHRQYSIKFLLYRFRQRGQFSPVRRQFEKVERMEADKMYSLPDLPYAYNALAPHISEDQLRLHHQKHHQAYVNGANAVLEKLDKARKENADLDFKATLRELSFHVGGFKLHTLFWENMAPGRKWRGRSAQGGTPKSHQRRIRKIRTVQKRVQHGRDEC